MQQGGNRKLHEFLNVYNLTDVIDIKVKYNTKAADYYRRRNNALAQEQPFEESPPDVQVGRTLLDGRRLDASGVPQALTEEERANLTPQELAMGGNRARTAEEVKAGQAAGIPGAEPVNAFIGLVQSTVTSVYTKAATAAANVDTDDAAEKAKASLVTGASYAKESVSVGAGVAMQKGSEAYELTAEYTKYGLDQAAEKTQMAAGAIYDVGCDAGSAVKSRLDETGITDKAKAAGGYVYSTGEAAATTVIGAGYAGMTAVNAKIDESTTLANMKKQAAEGANQAATYMSSLFGWGTGAAANPARQPEEVKVMPGANDEAGEIIEESKDASGAAAATSNNDDDDDDGFG